jgi:DNA-binding response OmpR family regulator
LAGSSPIRRRRTDRPRQGLLRRGSLSGASDVLQHADLRLGPKARLAWRGDRVVTLTKTEFDLLELLIWNTGIVLSHDVLYERIWGCAHRRATPMANRRRRIGTVPAVRSGPWRSPGGG